MGLCVKFSIEFCDEFGYTRVQMNTGWERRLATSLLWIGSLIAVDQATKRLANHYLLPYDPQELLGSLVRFTLAHNPGGIYGTLSQYGPWFLIFSIAVLISILFLLVLQPWTGSLLRFGLIGVVGGASGNMLDRLLVGSVTDFIDIGITTSIRWPVFNIADVAILGWHVPRILARCSNGTKEMSGKFIVLEGIDGSGKSTQADRLCAHYEREGHQVVCLKEPGRTAVGERIRELFLDANLQMSPLTEALLIEASRHELVRSVIRDALADGKLVICQRYAYSTIAYQGYGRGLDIELLNKMNDSATGGLTPDVAIFIDVPADEGWKRVQDSGTPDRLESEGLKFLREVESGYHRMLKSCPEMVKVDGTQEIDTIFHEIVSIVDSVIGGNNGF